jgi:hypothetical protein
LADAICPGSICPHTIQKVLETLTFSRQESSKLVLPGAYPDSEGGDNIDSPPEDGVVAINSTSKQYAHMFATSEEWKGIEVPFSVIKDHYKISWDTPLGRGSYGKVLEVTILLHFTF